MTKALIASDVYPYNTILRHGENCLLVKESRPRDWYRHIRTLTSDKDLRESLAQTLRLDVADKFDINYWGKVRMELYRNLL